MTFTGLTVDRRLSFNTRTLEKMDSWTRQEISPDYLPANKKNTAEQCFTVFLKNRSVSSAKTPEIGIENARKLLDSLDIGTLVGLRDRAIIAVMIYTAARVSAVSKMNVRDFYDVGNQYCLRLGEKGGKSREIPCRHDLQLFIEQYLSRIESHSKCSPLFLTAIGKTDRLSDRRMSSDDISRMVKRKCSDIVDLLETGKHVCGPRLVRPFELDLRLSLK